MAFVNLLIAGRGTSASLLLATAGKEAVLLVLPQMPLYLIFLGVTVICCFSSCPLLLLLLSLPLTQLTAHAVHTTSSSAASLR
jgi:hypothetical protein